MEYGVYVGDRETGEIMGEQRVQCTWSTGITGVQRVYCLVHGVWENSCRSTGRMEMGKLVRQGRTWEN